MIATLNGTVSEKLAELIVLEVHGVGYGVFVPAEDHGKLKVGDKTKLFIYEYIREDADDLFGFTSLDTKALFEQLLSVNGVGTRMALNMLSIGTANELRQAIASGDTKFIQAAKGVGKRAAERVVVDLKDKVGLAAGDLESSGILQADSHLLKDEAVEALVSLGFSPQDAALALKGVDTDLPTKDRVKLALKSRA